MEIHLWVEEDHHLEGHQEEEACHSEETWEEAEEALCMDIPSQEEDKPHKPTTENLLETLQQYSRGKETKLSISSCNGDFLLAFTKQSATITSAVCYSSHTFRGRQCQNGSDP